MQIVTSVAAMQRLSRRWQRAGARIGFVPTMGSLHEGHFSLVRRARRDVGARGRVVVSIYVNPTQFGPNEDFSRYPRDLGRDLRLCRAAGVDAVFAPGDKEMYPGWGEAAGEPARARQSMATTARADARPTRFSTCVVEENLSRTMEGASRPRHFRGVTTVVAKLFNSVQPDVAVFGAKDFQQAAIIRRMVRDLNFPLEIVVAPTLREPDGLAMSSRNRWLTGGLRAQAVVLWLSIRRARAVVRGSSRPASAARLRAEVKKVIDRAPAARLDYVEFFEPETLAPVPRVTRGTQMALAVFIGKTRLIDNARL